MSLDALRGFDMLWIMGGGLLVIAVCRALGYADGSCVYDQMHHAAWHGLRFMDTVFPLFLFIAGAAFPFSCARRLEKGCTRSGVALAALRRGILLFLIGIAYENSLDLRFADFRVWSVLGRIGFAWMVGAWLYLVCGIRARLAVFATLLVGSALFFGFVPAPGSAAGTDPFSAEGNFGCWLDRTLTAGHTYRPLFDPEGFAGLLPSVATAMLGTFAGEWLRRAGASGGRKTLGLLAGAALCGGLAGVFSLFCPVNKALWSSSFVLAVGAYSLTMLAVFYWIVDVRGWRKWTFPLRVIGVNSIAIYLAQAILDFHHAGRFLFGGIVRQLPAAWQETGSAAAYLATCWLFLWLLYRNRVFFKV